MLKMKRLIRTLMTAVCLAIPSTLFSQSYQTLWKQVDEAQQKDLPQTAIQHLQTIEKKAEREKAYGHLLKSTLLHARLQAEVSPDSLKPAVEGLQRREKDAGNMALQAVYAAVLYHIYTENYQLGDDREARSKEYFRHATANPEVLAKERADGYVPFVIKGKDSELFGHDLLSVIGAEVGAWQWMNQYYGKVGNRQAACLAAVQMADRIEQLDSLIACYGDLPVACELAIKRYELMDERHFTASQRADWLQQSLNRWGSWRSANLLRNHWTLLTNPSYQISLTERLMEVQRPQTVRLTHLRHLQQLTMRVYRTTLSGDTELDPNELDDYRKMKGGLTELKDFSRTVTFAHRPSYEIFEDSLALAGLPAGIYMLEFSTQPQTQVSRSLYFVSGIRIMMQAQPQNRMRYVVVDATTGQPVKGATLRLAFQQDWNKPKTTHKLTCNNQGEATYTYTDSKRPTEVFAYTASDRYCPPSDGYGRYGYYELRYQNEHINLFTDRSIYRPGQTVHAAAIVWKDLGPVDNEAVAGKSVKMELRDANYKLVAEQQVVTDRFGKCAASFVLPMGQLNGRFTIRAAGGSTSFRVEEYKRPTFQLTFQPYTQSYQAGDTVRIQAKAESYAGVPVQGAKVRYTVRRQVAFWWLSYSWYWKQGDMGRSMQQEVLYKGETETASDGTFMVTIPLQVPENPSCSTMFYHFVAEADVTDVAGETHGGTTTLPLGTKPTALTCDLPLQVRKDQMPTVTFSRRNAAGKEIDGVVRYRIDDGKWQECKANVQSSIFKVQTKSGEHRLEAVCDSDSLNVRFVVFGLDDKRPALVTDDWFYVSHNEFPSDGSPVTVQVGASDADMHIVYGIFAGDKMIEGGSVEKSDALVNRKFTYQETYGNALLITYAWVKNGQCHMHQTTIRRPMPDKTLRMTWETFRDRLTPGQQEEWRLKIMAPTGGKADALKPADASLMAVLYDKSLDMLVPHNWSFAPSSYLSMPSTGWQWTLKGSVNCSGSQSYQLLNAPALTYSSFDSSVYPYYHYPIRVRGAQPMLMSASARVNKSMDGVAMYNVADAAEESAGIEQAKAEVTGQSGKTAAEEAKNPESESVTVRENLSETAFFYPALETDASGNVYLKFTLPESLTTWRFMGVAHTQDMLYGTIGGEAIAKKDVMIQPHVPRFVRMGDKVQLSARIFNTGEKTAGGNARLQLLDAETEQVVFMQEQPFCVESEKTATVTFPLDSSLLTIHSSLLICKMTASGDGFSDGEQHYLPVLPDCEYVTKTISYTQHEPGTKRIELSKLFPEGTSQQKLTVEYTNNPAWLTVQSLPVVGQPYEHSAIDQAAAYYSNLLGKTLLAQSPQVKSVFEQWKRESLTSNSSSLTSQLKTNQELKDLLLEETPWVLAADREAEQKQHLADFFDENGLESRLQASLDKLQKLQLPDGSFTWYPGMRGSTGITLSVMEMLSRLKLMAEERKEAKSMQDKAFGYAGREMVRLVTELKKQERKGKKPSFPSFTALRWLYVCAIDKRTLPADVASANSYLTALLKKDMKNQTIYEKALTAVVLASRGENRLAATYVKSLKEYSVYTEEMGRYYDTPRAAYSWYDYKIPTEVAALEALCRVTPQDVQTVDEMRRWLLQEKRTQTWDTPVNSVNAIYAFLYGHAELLAKQEPTVLALDQQPLELSNETAGIGYVKKAIQQPKGRELTAVKVSTGTSWGAVYAQFLQKTSEVESAQNGMRVKREVMVAGSSSGSSKTSTTGNTGLKVGDRIKVRIVIETSRDYDFVQVIDHRAACMEPVRVLSGYQQGAYVSPKDYSTCYFYQQLSKGRHVIETEYYVDRAGCYETGTCSVQCAYAPDYRATAPSLTLHVGDAVDSTETTK